MYCCHCCISLQWCASCRQQITDNSTRDFTAYGGHYAQSMNPDDHGTSHLSVVDSQRGAVAMTTTINTGFGSKVISNSTGLLLLAHMHDLWSGSGSCLICRAEVRCVQTSLKCTCWPPLQYLAAGTCSGVPFIYG